MKLPLDVRRQLHNGPAEFDWPLSTEPHKGRTYKLQTNEAEWTFVVVDVEEVEAGPAATARAWRVCARLHSEPIRLLGKKGDYTESFAHALRARDQDGNSEPEGLQADVQQEMTDAVNGNRANQRADLAEQLAEVYSTLERIQRHPAAKAAGRELHQARGRVRSAQGKLTRLARVE